MQAAVLGGGTNTLPGLLDGGIGQAHNIKGRQSIGNIALGHNAHAPDAGDAQSTHTADHSIIPYSPDFISSYPMDPKNSIIISRLSVHFLYKYLFFKIMVSFFVMNAR